MRLFRLIALLFALALATPLAAQDYATMSTAQLEAAAPRLHPAAIYHLAAKTLSEGKGEEAARWMYAGQLRYRFLLSARSPQAVKAIKPGDDEAILFSALTEQVGRPINEYIGGNVDDWIAAINWALDWDARNANPITSKTQHAATLASIRKGLVDFRDSLDGRRDEIRAGRAKNGLPNR